MYLFHCIKSCKHKRDNLTDMIQCTSCMIWHHYDCINENEEDISAIWCCEKCRKTSSKVDSILNEVLQLKTTFATLQQANIDLVKQLAAKTVKCQELISENDTLKKKMTEMTAKNNKWNDHAKTERLRSSLSEDVDITWGNCNAACDQSITMESSGDEQNQSDDEIRI